MEHYYLLNGTVKKGGEMPKIQNYKLKITFEASYNDWKDSLQPCEIDESELMKIRTEIADLLTDNPIDITDIVSIGNEWNNEKQCFIDKIYFKQPQQF